MYKFSQDLVNKLSSFNQRKLYKGEIFLLAKSIADELPLLPPDEDNVKLFLLNHKRFIDEVVWCLNTYTYLNEDEVKTLNKLIGDLTLWRASVAYNPSVIFFRDCPDSVIDDISSLPRFIDITYMCAVGDIINNANYIANLFRSFVKEIKLSMVTESDSPEAVPSK